jgi:ubiquitin-like domain-containing CTD phosphatase 1
MIKEVKTPLDAPLLSLFSAHDTTILPILATLGENVWDGETWAPYASMIVIEVHKVGDGNDRAFRLIYNGKVLTDKVDGCLKGLELCDVMYLFNQLRDVAVKERDCATTTSSLSEDAIDFGKVLLTKEGVSILFLLTILSGTMGGILTFVFLTRRLPYRRKDGKGVFNKAPSTLPMDDVDDIEVTHPYGYGAPDTSSNSSKELVLEENIIL